MDFLVLGHLEIISDTGEPVHIPQPVHRAILSVLLFYAGRPCSHAKLIDAIWGDAPPKDPVRTLLSHISRIRRVLSDAGRLQTMRGAYRMNPGPDELDLYRFHRLRSRAQTALTEGHPEQAAAFFASALDCWGSAPLADLPSTHEIDADVAQLLEQRRSTETEFIDLLLSLGCHQQVVPDLQRLVTTDPLAERSWGQLMLALYRSGRKGEALAAYSTARAAMIRTLGTEPTQGLQDLLAQILSNSAELNAPPAPRPAVRYRLPRLVSFPAPGAPRHPDTGGARGALRDVA